MKDYRDRIGGHAMFDDDRYWRFTRDSRLPYGTFGRSHPDRWVFVAAIACFIAGMLIAGVTQ